jgi:hypothetical protein
VMRTQPSLTNTIADVRPRHSLPLRYQAAGAAVVRSGSPRQRKRGRRIHVADNVADNVAECIPSTDPASRRNRALMRLAL